MGKNHLKKSIIPKDSAKNADEFKYLNRNTALLEGWNNDGNNAYVLVSIRFLQHAYQCFSDWSKEEMKMFWSFLEKVHNQTWQQIYSSGGKTDKNGMGYTTIPIKQYSKVDLKDKLSPDITLFELRVDQEKRVHGFRNKSIFYICLLDKDHEICPE